MKQFELISASGKTKTTAVIDPRREALWAEALGVESLDNLFDMTPADAAIPLLDAALARFHQDPESLRPHVDPEDATGLRMTRSGLLGLRKHLIQFGGVISGVFEDVVSDTA